MLGQVLKRHLVPDYLENYVGLASVLLVSAIGTSLKFREGVLLTEANKVSLFVGEALMANGIRVLVTDTRRGGLREAQMKNMTVSYGNPLSEKRGGCRCFRRTASSRRGRVGR